jgi:hypothetical protein
MRKRELQRIEHEKYLLRSAWSSLSLSGLSQDLDDDFKIIENYFIHNSGSIEDAKRSLYNVRDYLGGMDIYVSEGYDECFDYFINTIKTKERGN